MTTRRQLIVMLAASALVPRLSSAQQGKIWRVGFLAPRHIDFVESDYYYGPFTQGMRELGYIDGKNLLIEWRSAEGRFERLAELAAELVRLNVDVIAAAATPASLAAQKATTSIPIVMIDVADPVGAGLVKNLAQPRGNSTGLSNMTGELGPKLLEMLRGMLPNVAHVALLVNPSNSVNVALHKVIESAASKSGIKLQPVRASTAQGLAEGFLEIARQKAGALIVPREAFFLQQKAQIVSLIARQRLPSISASSDFVEAGCLMSYGNDIRDNYRRAAVYVDKIIKGAKPGDLPVEQPTKFELFVNAKTAKVLGIKVPPSLLMQATKVID